jgi:hypothetical protein
MFADISKTPQGKLKLGMSLILIVAGFAYMVRQVLLSPNIPPFGIDFEYIWVAGKIWAEGGNPYDASFSALSTGIVERSDPLHRWAYGPHFWPVAKALILLDHETARLVWGTLSCVLITCGVGWSIAAMPAERRFSLLSGSTLFLYASVCTPTILCLISGQYAAFIFAGAALFSLGLVRQSALATIAGLVLLTLKPSIGLPFVALALALPDGWRLVTTAACAALILAAPGLVSTGIAPFVTGYLDGVSAYSSYAPNAPNELTGVTTLLWHFAGINVSPLLLLVFAMGLIVVLRLRLGRSLDLEGTRADLVGATLATTILLIPLHTYDLVIAVALVVMWRGPLAIGTILFLWAVLLRLWPLSDALGFGSYDQRFAGTVLASLALLAGFLFLVVPRLLRGPRAGPAEAESSTCELN